MISQTMRASRRKLAGHQRRVLFAGNGLFPAALVYDGRLIRRCAGLASVASVLYDRASVDSHHVSALVGRRAHGPRSELARNLKQPRGQDATSLALKELQPLVTQSAPCRPRKPFCFL